MTAPTPPPVGNLPFIKSGGFLTDYAIEFLQRLWSKALDTTPTTGSFNAATNPIPPASAALEGARAYVTDCTANPIGNFGQAYVAGGAFKAPVWCNGTTWRIG